MLVFSLLSFTPQQSCAWTLSSLSRSLSLSSSSIPQTNPSPTVSSSPRHICAESLVQHLLDGKSQINDHLSIVTFSEDECGIQYNDREEDKEQVSMSREVQSDGTQQHQPPQHQLAYIDRQEFVTPNCGRETRVGQLLDGYLRRNRGELDRLLALAEEEDTLQTMYVAIFLCEYCHQQNDQGAINDDHHSHQRNNLSQQQYEKFDTYFQTLPSLDNLQHLPVFWSQDSLEELQGSSLYEGILQRRRAWEEEYRVVSSALHEEEGERPWVDLETWYWARAIIKSRAFKDGSKQSNPQQGDKIDDNGALCLVPYIDMMNHCSSLETAKGQARDAVQCSWSLDSSGFSLTKPQQPSNSRKAETPSVYDEDAKNNGLSTSSSVEISYGSHSNAVMLMNYGFATLDDTHQTLLESTRISFSAPRVTTAREDVIGDEISLIMEELWGEDCRDNDAREQAIHLSIGDPGPMVTLLSLCRVKAASDNPGMLLHMFSNFKKRGETTTQDTKDGLIPAMAATLSRVPFSISNEIQAMECLKATLEEQLFRYKTSLAQDEVLLLAGREHGEDESAVEYRNKKGSGILSRVRMWWSKRFPRNRENRIPTLSSSDIANTRNAIIFRRGEKRVMMHFYNLANVCLEFLSDPAADLDEYAECLEDSLQSENPILLPTLL